MKEEDLVFEIFRDIENVEIIILGFGEIYFNIIVSKIKSKFGVDVILDLFKIFYREVIKGFVDV